MAYQTGIANNSHELSNIVHNMMLSVGWQKIATLQDGYDAVFYSRGEDGYQDIYLRVAAGVSDNRTEGDVQFPISDGYNGFVNLFAYQSYVNNSILDKQDGYNMIGKHGPLLYLFNNRNLLSTGLNFAREYNLSSSCGYKGSDSAFDGDSGRVLTLGSLLFGSNVIGATQSFPSFDGHRYAYYYDSSTIYKWDTATNEVLNFLNPSLGSGSVSSKCGGFSIYNTGKYATNRASWGVDASATSSTCYLFAYNHGKAAYEYGFAHPPWGNVSATAETAWMVFGARRNNKQYMYHARGSSTTSWARYDMELNTWSGLLTAPPSVNAAGSSAIFVPREVTGYEYDRIYVFPGGAAGVQLISIAIDDNGDTVSGWTTHASPPGTTASPSGARLFYAGKSIFYYSSISDSTAFMGGRAIARFDFPSTATAGGNWRVVSNNWLGTNVNGSNSDGVPAMYVKDHLCSRVRLLEHFGNTFWALVNKNRVIIVVKNHDPQITSQLSTIAFGGLFTTFRDSRTTKTTSNILGGTAIPVEDVSIFKMRQEYQIVDTTGSGDAYEDFSKQILTVAPSETIVISGIDYNNSIIHVESPLNFPYSAGSKVGEDPQPICVSMENDKRVQTLNNLNLVDGHNSRDPVNQWYSIQNNNYSSAHVENTLYDSTYLLETNNKVGIWPIVLHRNQTSFNRGEIRGQLDGIYGTSYYSNGQTIVIDGKNYLIVRDSAPYNEYKYWANGYHMYVVGPLE